MPKNPHADFTPALEGYSGQGKFRFWCQMALPLTYDDSLSYYELLCKVVNYLNHTIEDVANAETNVSRLAEAYTQLQNYVNNYFDDLDIEAELRNVLDAMAEDGTLDDLLDPLVQDHLPSVVDDKIDDVVADQIGDAVAGQIDDVVAEQLPPLVDEGIPGEVSDWLTENVDPVGSAVVVDSSLTISGAAADAKATGDELADLKTQLNNGKTATPGYILTATGEGTGNTWSPVGTPTDGQVDSAVSNWLDVHPEATTTVEDGSLTEAKFTDELKLKTIKDYVTPQMYGAVGDGVADDTIALKNAIIGAFTEKKPVLITKDTILKITETITISGGTILIIDGRINAYECDAIKVVGVRSKITGNGTINGDGTHIGVIFGGLNKSTNVNYNIIECVKIDNFDTGISIYNDQSDNLTVYFNILTNLNIGNCRIGIGFYGYADAMLVSKIVFTNCGTDDTTGGAFVFRNINDQFPLENTIQQIFHHYSTNAITLNIEKVQHSQFAGIVCEQGGNSAKSIVITNTGTLGNQFYITTNTAAFRTIPDSCMKNNVFVDVNGLSAGAATVYGDFSVKGFLTHGGTGENGKLFIKKQFKKTGIAENTTVELFTISKVVTDCPRIFKVKVLTGTSVQASTLRKYSEAIIYYSGITTTDVKVIQNLGNTSTPAISVTTDGIVSAFSGDNGTGTSEGFMLLEIEQIKDNSALSSNLNCTIGEGFVEM